MLGMLAWLLWPSGTWSAEPEPLIAFLVAIVAWAYTEWISWQEFNKKQHPHDIQLAKLIMEKFDENALIFLREQDLLDKIRRDETNFLVQIVDQFKGERFKFHNSHVRLEALNLLNNTNTFAHNLFIHLHDNITSSPFDLVTLQTEDDQKTPEISQTTWKISERLNRDASNIVASYERFERLLRKELPEAFLPPM